MRGTLSLLFPDFHITIDVLHFHREIDSDGRRGRAVELVVAILVEQAGLADSLLTDDDDLDEEIVAGRIHFYFLFFSFHCFLSCLFVLLDCSENERTLTQ